MLFPRVFGYSCLHIYNLSTTGGNLQFVNRWENIKEGVILQSIFHHQYQMDVWKWMNTMLILPVELQRLKKRL